MRVLVTGGAGFIGSHYVRTLVGGGYPGFENAAVTVLDKFTYAGRLANLAPVLDEVTVMRGDIADPMLLAQIVPGHDVVVNFAAESHVDRSIVSAPAFVVTNVLGTQTLLQACLDARVPRVVHVSTDEVYGSIDEGSWREDAPLDPNSPYSATKAGGDLIAGAYARTHGLDVVITRCCNNYGPYQFPEKVIPLFVTNLLAGARLPVHGDGRHVRGWVHVDDHCRGIQLALEKGQAGEVYHINGDAELSTLELTEYLLEACRALGAPASWNPLDHVPDRKCNDRRYALDDTRLRRLGYEPRTPFARGLAATVRWYAENRAWWEPLKEETRAETRDEALSSAAYSAPRPTAGTRETG